jgi:hypothetical protein
MASYKVGMTLFFASIGGQSSTFILLKTYLENTLVTLGDRVGVTEDLVKLTVTTRWSWQKTTGNEDYSIFSELTFEGSHILVQLFNDNLKVLLISSKHASNVIENIGLYDSSKFWLCDLSGSVTATNDSETERGQNVLDFILQIDNLMFDLLAFNGSLQQILLNPKLKVIYYNWLNSENFEKRAIFLRLRMKALMSKEAEMFEIDDHDLGLLKKFSLGIKNTADSLVDGYPKAAIDVDFEIKSMALLKITPRSHRILEISQNSPIEFDLDEEIRKILKITKEEESNSSESAGPDFVFEQVEFTTYDDDLDKREIPSTKTTTRAIIKIADYPMASENVRQESVNEEPVIEVLDNEILVNESMADYQEPALTELDPIEMTEIIVNHKFNPNPNIGEVDEAEAEVVVEADKVESQILNQL